MLRKWLAAVKNDKYGVHTKYEAVKHLRVCGRHFVDSDFTDEFRLAKQLMPGQKKQPRMLCLGRKQRNVDQFIPLWCS